MSKYGDPKTAWKKYKQSIENDGPASGDLPPMQNQMGWMCPGCGSCYGPYTPECTRCNKTQITCGVK